jgi:2-keto-4-pentenoate hydratase/2-oxohepta-3-ene-1,7-dioic acid hydratase in catechol pathway
MILRSWAHRSGERYLYQESAVATLLSPLQLLAMYDSSATTLPVGSAMFGGTIATVDAIAPADAFEIELEDPTLGRRLHHHYRIETLPANA